MSFMSDYEKQRAKNIAENKRILAGLGFDKPFSPFPSIPKKKTSSKQVKRKRTEVQKPRKELAVSSPDQSSDDGRPLRRRSGRLLGKEPGDFQFLDFEIDEEDEKPKKVERNRENVFGPIPGVEVGTTWETRVLCSAAGVHRPTVAGIHGNSEGCYSIALSGGYEDDLDYGECFTYTGEGGRDLKGTKANPKNLRTAPQSKDQTLSRGNLSLVKSVEKELPVRVIRGYKLDSPFAPEEGYRYDGLYNVEKYWKAVGMSGYVVYKFALKRCESQGPPIWQLEDNIEDSNLEESKEETNENTTRNSPNEKNSENTDTVEDNSDKTDKNQVRFEINGEKQNGSSSEDEKTQNGEFTDATEEKDLESIHSKSDNIDKEVETSKEGRREEKENNNKEDEDTSKTEEINEATESDKGE